MTDYMKPPMQVTEGLTVSIVFSHTYGLEQGLEASGAQCVYWDIVARGWNSTGCATAEEGLGATRYHLDLSQASCNYLSRCTCKHLTNFAVLMDINGVLSPSSSLSSALSLLTILCSSLSCLGLVLCLLVFTLV